MNTDNRRNGLHSEQENIYQRKVTSKGSKFDFMRPSVCLITYLLRTQAEFLFQGRFAVRSAHMPTPPIIVEPVCPDAVELNFWARIQLAELRCKKQPHPQTLNGGIQLFR